MQDPLREPDEPLPRSQRCRIPKGRCRCRRAIPLIAESIKLIIVSLVIDFHHILSEERRQRQFLPPYVFSALFMSVEEIVLIVRCSKVILCPGLTSERFAVTDLLKVVQSAGDSAVAVGVESVEVDGSPAVNAGVDFGTFQDRLSVSVPQCRERMRCWR